MRYFEAQCRPIYIAYGAACCVVSAAVTTIDQVLNVAEMQQKLQCYAQSPAADQLVAGITFACLASFDVDSSAPTFIVRRWQVSSRISHHVYLFSSPRCLRGAVAEWQGGGAVAPP